MNGILNQLYNENITISAPYCPSSKYHIATEKMLEIEEVLKERLDKESLALLESYHDSCFDVIEAYSEKYFSTGCKFTARLFKELFCGDLP